MATASNHAFMLGAKTLLLLKLEGEPSFGLHEHHYQDVSGRHVFTVARVDRLSAAERAGLTRDDRLLSLKILGVDRQSYAWCSSALARMEQMHEICIMRVCVKKADGARISDLQQRRHSHISSWLTKAKMLSISNLRFRGDFIIPQLHKVVVHMYDFEHTFFAQLWKELGEHERSQVVIPVARAFVSDTRLPGLVDATSRATPRPTPMPTSMPTPVSSPRATNPSEQTDTRPSSPGTTETERSRWSPETATESAVSVTDLTDLDELSTESTEPALLQDLVSAASRTAITARRGFGVRRRRFSSCPYPTEPMIKGREDDEMAHEDETNDVVFVKRE